MTTRSILAFAATAALLNASPVAAQHDHVDITLVQDVSGKLITGTSHVDGGSPDYHFPVRVYERGFDSVEAFKVFQSNSPGFTAPESTDGLPLGYGLLPINTDVGFNFKAFNLRDHGLTNLAYWDGTGPVEFSPAPAGHVLAIGAAQVDGGGNDVAGDPAFTDTDANGGIHEHLTFTLGGGAPEYPTEGIYMWSLEMTMPGLTASEPIYILHETPDAPLTLDDAVGWAEENLHVLGVPEPGSIMLLLSGLLAVGVGRRRRG